MNKKVFISPERRPYPHGIYAYGNTDEHTQCYDIGERTKTELEAYGFDVFIAPRTWTLKQRVDYANANGFDYYLCIHTNAGGGTGTECLYYNHPASIKANRHVYDRLTALYPSKRGLKDYTKFYENNSTKMVSCYPEVAFHDNPADAKFVVENKPAIAKALAQGVADYYSISEQAPEPPKQPDEQVEVTVTMEEYKALQRERDRLKKEKEWVAQDLEWALQNLESYQDELRELKEQGGNPAKEQELERKLEAIAAIVNE